MWYNNLQTTKWIQCWQPLSSFKIQLKSKLFFLYIEKRTVGIPASLCPIGAIFLHCFTCEVNIFLDSFHRVTRTGAPIGGLPLYYCSGNEYRINKYNMLDFTAFSVHVTVITRTNREGGAPQWGHTVDSNKNNSFNHSKMYSKLQNK